MILDASAVVAMILDEPGCMELLDKVAVAQSVGIGAPTVAEAGIVLSARLGMRGRTLLARFLQESDAEVIPFGPSHWSVSLDAFERYGKRRHPAALNFGDCMAYAMARVAGHPLLCTGNDFARTDIPVA